MKIVDCRIQISEWAGRKPAIAIAAPMFAIWRQIGLYDTLVGLIIPKMTFALPLAIYTLTSFFR